MTSADLQSRSLVENTNRIEHLPQHVIGDRFKCHDLQPEIRQTHSKNRLRGMFWQDGRCQRGAMCKYAHGEEERRAACLLAKNSW